MILKNQVLDFIEPFQDLKTIEAFVLSNSFWFAYILHGRFSKYNPWIVYAYDEETDDYYYGTHIGSDIYDITGIITNQYENWMPYTGEINDVDILK